MKALKRIFDNEPQHNGADGITSGEYMQAFKNSTVVCNYKTPDYLFDMGICRCDKCGELCSVDNKWCKKCSDTVIMIR